MWNKMHLDVLTHHELAAQSQSIIVATFFQALSSDKTLPVTTKAVLWDLYRLFALNTMENEAYECKVPALSFANLTN